MNPLGIALFAIMSGWPQPKTPDDRIPESPGEFEDRVAVSAEAISLEARTVEEAAEVAVVWWGESRLLREIHDGTIRGDNGRAICFGSIHPHDPDWATLAGTSLAATRRCARATIRHLRSSLWTCAREPGPLEGRLALAFEHYARGHCAEPRTKSWERAGKSIRLARRIYGELARLGKEARDGE